MTGPADGLFPQAVLIVAVRLGPLGQEHPLAAPQGRQLLRIPPQANPASDAAPKAVVSTMAGRSTGIRSRSACICIRMSDTLAPPSARRAVMSHPASCRMASIRSVT